jgi:hypothetical protein
LGVGTRMILIHSLGSLRYAGLVASLSGVVDGLGSIHLALASEHTPKILMQRLGTNTRCHRQFGFACSVTRRPVFSLFRLKQLS